MHLLSPVRLTFLACSALFLAACGNLTAELTGGTQTFPYTPAYEVDGLVHRMVVTIIVLGKNIKDVSIVPDAATPIERAYQLAFAANVRMELLGKVVSEISLSPVIGSGPEAERLMRVFVKQVLEPLKRAVL